MKKMENLGIFAMNIQYILKFEVMHVLYYNVLRIFKAICCEESVQKSFLIDTVYHL